MKKGYSRVLFSRALLADDHLRAPFPADDDELDDKGCRAFPLECALTRDALFAPPS